MVVPASAVSGSPNMKGRFDFHIDQPPSWPGSQSQSASRPRRPVAPDYRVINSPNRGGDASHYAQPRFVLEPEHRGFGLKTGIMRTPENLIDDFNRETQTIQSESSSNFAPREQRDHHRMDGLLSPTLTLTNEGVDLGDLSFGGTFEDDVTTSPTFLQSPFSRTDLGIPSSQPLSRNASQASSNLQDDTISLAYSTTSADDFGLPLGIKYCTPGTSFSQEQPQTSAPLSFPGNSPATRGFYHSSQSHNSSSSPRMDLSFDFDWSFSTMSSDMSESGHARSMTTPRRLPRQSALSQSLADSPIPRAADVDLLSDPYYEKMAYGEEALSAEIVRLDSQDASVGLIPYQLDSGYSHINVTPAEPHDPLDMFDPLATDDFEGTSLGPFHPYDRVPFQQAMPHSFPKPQAQVKDDRLAVPDRSFGLDQRRPLRRPRAFSNSASRPASASSSHRTNASTKPIPIPSQPRSAKLPMPRSLPGSLPHGTRGRRKGPMEATARQSAKKTRNEKTVCIRCRGSKQKCQRPEDQPEGRCINCEKVVNTPKFTGSCTKAYFEDIVLQGSLDGDYALEMTHPTANGQRRLRRRVPSHFSLDYFISELDQYRSRFNLMVCDGDRPLYGLDVEMCHQYMSKVKESLKEEFATDFIGFLDRDLAYADSKTEDWTKMVINTNAPRDDIIEFYLDIARMSEHVSLLFVSRDADHAQQRPINPDVPIEANILDMAARLVRIVMRKVEVCAFLHLQKELHEVLQNPLPQQQTSTFLYRIGRFLVTLRSRIARATAAAAVSGTPPSLTESRATELCRVIWSYYYYFRKKMPPVIGEPWDNMLKGMWMPSAPAGADTPPGLSPAFPFSPPSIPFPSPSPVTEPGEVWHTFPPASGDSTAGFESWMAVAPEGHQTMFMS